MHFTISLFLYYFIVDEWKYGCCFYELMDSWISLREWIKFLSIYLNVA